jgi:hypothetical protein
MSARKLFSKSPLDTFRSLLCRRGGVRFRVEALHGRLFEGGVAAAPALRPKGRAARRACVRKLARAGQLGLWTPRASSVKRPFSDFRFAIFDFRFIIPIPISDIIRTRDDGRKSESKI